MATFNFSSANFSAVATNFAFNTTADPSNFTYAHPGGELYVFINFRSNGVTVSGVTYDGVALSQVVDSGQGGANPGPTSAVWQLRDPGPKSATLAVDFSAAPLDVGIYCVAAPDTTVDSSGSVANSAGATPTVTHNRVSAQTLTVYAGCRPRGAAAQSWSPNDGMTEAFDDDAGTNPSICTTLCFLEESASGSLARSSTSSSSGKNTGAAISLVTTAGYPRRGASMPTPRRTTIRPATPRSGDSHVVSAVEDGTWRRPAIAPPRQVLRSPRAMKAWDVLVDTPAAGGTPPSYVSTGTYVTAAGDVDLVITIPACDAGDLLYLHFGHLNSAQVSATYPDPAGWELRYLDQGASARQWVYRRVSDGTEGGTTVTVSPSGGIPTGTQRGVVHRFSNAAPAFEDGPSATAGTGITVDDAGVTTTVNNCLALQFGLISPSQSALDFDGESGGDWSIATQTPAGSAVRLFLQTANKPTPGTIDGGSFDKSGTGAWVVRGFALTYEDAGTRGNDSARPNPPHFQRTQRLIRHLHTEGPPEDAAPHTGYQFTPRRFYPIPPVIRPRYGRNGTLVEPVAPPAEDPLPFLPHTARPVSRVFYRVIRGRKPDGVLLDDEVARIDSFVVHPPVQAFQVSHRIIRPKVITDGWLGEDDEVAEPGDSWPVIPRFRSSYRIIRPRSGHSAVESTAEIDLILSVVLDDAELDAVVAVEARKAMIAESLLTEKAKGVRRTRMGYRAPKKHF